MKFWRLTGSTAGVVVGNISAALTGVQSSGAVGSLGGSAILPNVVVRRVTGPAPLFVHFDATGTTSALTSSPYFELDYTWDFDDVGSGDWAYGAYAALGQTWSKNMDKGPIAAHVYETPGTYAPSCTMRYDTTTNTYYTTEIVVTDPDSVYGNANTYYISNTLPVAGVNGVPSGATNLVASSDGDAALAAAIADGKRILFCRGDTFALSSSMLIRNNDVFIGAYGTGAKPYFTIGGNFSGVQFGGGSATTYNRAVVMDLALDATGYVGDSQGFGSGGGFDDALMFRCDVSNVKFGWKFSTSDLNAYNNSINPATDEPIVHQWRGHGVVDCSVNGLCGNDNGSNGFYMGGEWCAILGTNVDPNFLGEHGIRSPHLRYAVIAHNKIQRIDDGRAYITIRSPDQGASTLPPFVYGTYVYTEYLYVNDNDNDGGSTQPLTAVGVGPTNQSASGRNRMCLFERNYLSGISTSLSMFGVTNHARLNIFALSYLSTFFTEATSVSPNATDLHYYHNSAYARVGGPGDANFWNPNDGGMDASSIVYIRNNLIYQPDRAGHTVVASTANLTTVASNNTNSTQIESNNPFSATTPPTTAMHWKPAGGSYAIDAGIDLPVWSDFLNVAMYSAGTRDMGAIQS